MDRPDHQAHNSSCFLLASPHPRGTAQGHPTPSLGMVKARKHILLSTPPNQKNVLGGLIRAFYTQRETKDTELMFPSIVRGWGWRLFNVGRERKGEGEREMKTEVFLQTLQLPASPRLRIVSPSHHPLQSLIPKKPAIHPRPVFMLSAQYKEQYTSSQMG